MKGDRPMTGRERQENYRRRLKDAEGERTTVVLSHNAVVAMQKIQVALEDRGHPGTRKFAVESALTWYAKRI